jgi:hypothetical protein
MHELINYIDTKSKMSSSEKNWSLNGLCGRYLSEFVDWRYSQSCWYYWPSFVNWCPSNLLSGWTPPPPLPQSSLQVNYFRRRHFALPSMSLIFLWVNVMVQKDSDLSAGPPRAVNMKMESAERITCPDTWQGPARGKSPQTISTNGLPVEIASGVSADCRKDYSIF